MRAAVSRRRDATAPTVAASAALLVGVHAMVDFSLQIEAVTLTFMALLGAGVAQSRKFAACHVRLIGPPSMRATETENLI